jgi:hypothetical protein
MNAEAANTSKCSEQGKMDAAQNVERESLESSPPVRHHRKMSARATFEGFAGGGCRSAAKKNTTSCAHNTLASTAKDVCLDKRS